jgi:hypothetical protein
MIGSRLGPYEVTAAIGSGGMGEVYLATDKKLGRDVAIKVLPAELAGDPERLARFECEAQLLASHNHPNIAHVYGFESVALGDGSSAHFLAMELVHGEDLAERLKRGAIPVDEAIAIAKPIAEALEEAHEKGFVHRHLKPANVRPGIPWPPPEAAGLGQSRSPNRFTAARVAARVYCSAFVNTRGVHGQVWKVRCAHTPGAARVGPPYRTGRPPAAANEECSAS